MWFLINPKKYLLIRGQHFKFKFHVIAKFGLKKLPFSPSLSGVSCRGESQKTHYSWFTVGNYQSVLGLEVTWQTQMWPGAGHSLMKACLCTWLKDFIPGFTFSQITIVHPILALIKTQGKQTTTKPYRVYDLRVRPLCEVVLDPAVCMMETEKTNQHQKKKKRR